MRGGSYKELLIWQKAIDLADLVYRYTQGFPKSEEYGLRAQMRSAAVSIPSNIAEGSQRNSDREFCRFILIAKGSLAELETQTMLAEKFDYLKKEESQELQQRIDELQRMLYVFCCKLQAAS